MYLVMMFDRNKTELTASVYGVDNIEDSITLHLKDYNIDKHRYNRNISKNAAQNLKFNNYSKVIDSLRRCNIYLSVVAIPYNTTSVVVFFDNFINNFIYYINKDTTDALQEAILENRILKLGCRLDTLSLIGGSKFTIDKTLIYSNIFHKKISNKCTLGTSSIYNDSLYIMDVQSDTNSEVYISIYDKTYHSTLELIVSENGITAYKDTFKEIDIKSREQLNSILDRSPSSAKETVGKLVRYYHLQSLCS